MTNGLDRLAQECFWVGLDTYTPSVPLHGSERADLAIVGAGFTGLWIAYQTLRRPPATRVVVLDQEGAGYGTSGRNGGFAMTLVHRSLTTLAGLVGDDGAKRIHTMSKRAVEELTATVARENIRCDAESVGLLAISNTPPQDRRIEREIETAVRLGVDGDFQVLDGVAARERIRSERIRCGLFERHCTLVNPARLVRGLKTVVERMGVRVYEQTRVVDWQEREGGVTIKTDAGSVTADRTVLALNSYGARLAGLRGGVIPFYTYICVTRVLSAAEWASVSWTGREGVEDRRDGLHYFRPTADGRLVWGGATRRCAPTVRTNASTRMRGSAHGCVKRSNGSFPSFSTCPSSFTGVGRSA